MPELGKLQATMESAGLDSFVMGDKYFLVLAGRFSIVALAAHDVFNDERATPVPSVAGTKFLLQPP